MLKRQFLKQKSCDCLAVIVPQTRFQSLLENCALNCCNISREQLEFDESEIMPEVEVHAGEGNVHKGSLP